MEYFLGENKTTEQGVSWSVNDFLLIVRRLSTADRCSASDVSMLRRSSWSKTAFAGREDCLWSS